MQKSIIFSVVILLVLLPVAEVIGCAAPAPAPPPTPTPALEPAIPTHFTTYTQEHLFSISYPPDWEPALSIIEEAQQYVKEWVESLELLEPGEYEQKIIFLAGIRTVAGYYNPNVNIAIAPMMEGVSTLEEFVEVAIAGVKEFIAEDFREVSRVKTVVDGREAIILDIEMKFPDMDRLSGLQMHMIVDNVIWTVTCTADPEEFSVYKEDLYAIVKSLRILK